MPTTTTNLALNKTDTTSDGGGSFVDKNEYFNFDTDLNDNWDKIDSAVGKLSDLETTEQSNLVGAINEIVLNPSFVQKSGDTMTGTLEFDKDLSGINIPVSPNPEPCVWGRFDHVVGNANPASNIYALGRIVTDNGATPKLLGRDYWRFSSSGATAFVHTVYNYDANNDATSASTTLSVSPDGIKGFAFPKCDTKATTTSSASSSKVAVVTQNYVNGTSWYRVWSDGWIEQGGRVTGMGSSGTINLVKTMSNTNYSITLLEAYSSALNVIWSVDTDEITKTSFGIHKGGTTGIVMFWTVAGY